MTDFPKVIYLHDGQDEITWSERKEVGGVRYVKSESDDFDWCGTPEQEIEALRRNLEVAETKAEYLKDCLWKVALCWEESGVNAGYKEIVSEVKNILGPFYEW